METTKTLAETLLETLEIGTCLYMERSEVDDETEPTAELMVQIAGVGGHYLVADDEQTAVAFPCSAEDMADCESRLNEIEWYGSYSEAYYVDLTNSTVALDYDTLDVELGVENWDSDSAAVFVFTPTHQTAWDAIQVVVKAAAKAAATD